MQLHELSGLSGEVIDYDAYLGRRVYGYVIEQGGEEIDACWGFVGDYETHCLPDARNAVPWPIHICDPRPAD